jgi:hypothetical protein
MCPLRSFYSKGVISCQFVYYIVCFRHSTWKFFLLRTKQKWIDERSWRESIHLEVRTFYSLPFKFFVSNVTIDIVNQTKQHKHSRREKSQNKYNDFVFLLNKNFSYSFWNKNDWKNCGIFYIFTPGVVSWVHRMNSVMR